MSRLEKRPHNRKYSFFVLFYFMTIHVLVNMDGLFSLFVSMSTRGVYLKFVLMSTRRMYSNLMSFTWACS